MPASLLPHAAARNQTPSTSPTKPGGASSSWSLRPTGLTEQLAHRLQEEQPHQPQRADACPRRSASPPAPSAGMTARGRTGRARTSPGSRAAACPSRSQAKTKIGASRTTNRALSALVPRRRERPAAALARELIPNSAIEMPACSKTAQNTIEAMKKTATAARRRLSSRCARTRRRRRRAPAAGTRAATGSVGHPTAPSVP